MRKFAGLLTCLLFLVSTHLHAFTQSNTRHLEQLLAHAVQLQQSGDLEEAIREYEKFLEYGPEQPEVLSNLGAAYAGLGDYPKAIHNYQKALSLQEDNVSVRLNLGIAYYKAAESANAIEQLKMVLQVEPENKQAASLLADCYFRMGENREVIETLTPFADQAINDLAVAYLLGTALIRDNQLEKGQQIVEQLLRRGDSAEAHLMLGTAHQLALDFTAAVQEFETALELNPRLPGSYSLLARALLSTGERDRAIETFRTELGFNPNDFDANFYLGFLLREDRKYDEALPYLRKCQLLRPSALEVNYQIASLHLMADETEQAREILEDIVAKAPDFVEAHVSLATAYYRLKMKKAGDRHREIVLRLNAERQAEQPGAKEDLGPAYRGDEAVNVPRPPKREKGRKN
ncbi:tetratricopeptide repeat protein [Acidobacteria bacterium AH-259-O06]|nr:tetratricopeptide repeat protein [Acidobacteria bacterium AH-259-O06]